MKKNKESNLFSYAALTVKKYTERGQHISTLVLLEPLTPSSYIGRLHREKEDLERD
jgi:hypothetical protein